MPIVEDDYEKIKIVIRQAAGESDVILTSAGSSAGREDFVPPAIEELGELLVHGVSISPGKPTIIAKIGDKYLFGLPGNPVSVMVTFDLFVSLLIKLLSGAMTPVWGQQCVRATLSRNIASAPGREDYVRVRLIESEGGMLAEPVLGRSALISTMVKADGLFKIPLESEGLEEGAEVEVVIFAC